MASIKEETGALLDRLTHHVHILASTNETPTQYGDVTLTSA